MCGKKVSLLFFLFACYTEVTFGMDTEPVTQCGTDDECIILTECKSYMNFISSFEKPLKSPVVKFLRKKQCGFEGGFPKVCCSDISKLNFAATQLKSNYKMCKKKECMSLKDCRPYMDLVKKMEKPLKPLVVEFLRAQQCGFQEDYPMVCCSLLPKNFKILKHARPDSRPIDFKEHNQLSSLEFGLRDVFSKIETTTKPSVSDRDKMIREKSEAINNEFDLSDFFDFTGSFDLLRRRRRFNNDYSTPNCEARGQICIEIRKCPFFDDLLNKSSIPRPRRVIDIIRKNHCSLVNNTPYVCCDKPTPRPTSPPTPPPPQLQREEREDSLITIFDELDNDEDVSKHENYNLLRNDICGPILTNSRITAGKKTSLNEFPWMALIAYQTDHGLDFRCGGTVINERYVLTAAHCILNSSIVGVRLGEHNLETTKDCDSEENYCAPPTQDFYIEDVTVHPLYDSKTFNNDIALIRLATPANFSFSNVQPICLPSSELDSIGKYAIVSGWGVTETGYKSLELLKVSVPVLPISVCQRNYKRFAAITSNQICAGGYKGRDSCGGDSGGPMKYVGLIDSTPRFIQYGIVSYGPRHCGADAQPGVYTKVSPYLKWILDNLKPNNDDDLDFD